MTISFLNINMFQKGFIAVFLHVVNNINTLDRTGNGMIPVYICIVDISLLSDLT